MQKLPLIILTIIICAGAGFFAGVREKKRIRLLGELAAALSAARWELSASRTEAELLLSKHLGFVGANRAQQLKNALSLPLLRAEREMLCAFIRGFGSGEQLCECDRCKSASEYFAESASRDREESEKKAKLYMSGGMLCGLFLTLLMV